jgi:prophage regulatory protein
MISSPQPTNGQVKPLYVRLPEVKVLTGLSKSSIYRSVAAGLLPPPRKIAGGHASGWLLSDLEQWATSLQPTHNS